MGVDPSAGRFSNDPWVREDLIFSDQGFDEEDLLYEKAAQSLTRADFPPALAPRCGEHDSASPERQPSPIAPWPNDETSAPNWQEIGIVSPNYVPGARGGARVGNPRWKDDVVLVALFWSEPLPWLHYATRDIITEQGSVADEWHGFMHQVPSRLPRRVACRKLSLDDVCASYTTEKLPEALGLGGS